MQVAPSSYVRIGCAAVAAVLVSGCSTLATGPNPNTNTTQDAGSMISVDPDATITVPHWKTSFVFNGQTYAITMVGSSPLAAPLTTVVRDEIIPVNLVFSDGKKTEGSRETATLVNSPVYVGASYEEGTTQYADALARSEFYA